jgi:hypothetical protein
MVKLSSVKLFLAWTAHPFMKWHFYSDRSFGPVTINSFIFPPVIIVTSIEAMTPTISA